MIDFPYYALFCIIFSFTIGMAFLFGYTQDKKHSALFWGILSISLANLLGGTLLMVTDKGIPLKASEIKPFYEIQLEKRINQSLSLVKTANGNDGDDDRRVVKDIPIRVREGDVFMIKKDGSVVILKTPLSPSPIGDGIGGH